MCIADFDAVVTVTADRGHRIGVELKLNPLTRCQPSRSRKLVGPWMRTRWKRFHTENVNREIPIVPQAEAALNQEQVQKERIGRRRPSP